MTACVRGHCRFPEFPRACAPLWRFAIVKSRAAPYQHRAMPLTLPIEAALPDLKRTLNGARACVLEAPTGAGKTTLVPLAVRDEAWAKGKKILMLEPRRVAARAAASRMADLIGEK